jgi:hypothetical protein
MYPSERVIEWDEDDSILDVVDPYFLFYLRHSVILNSLRTQGGEQSLAAES